VTDSTPPAESARRYWAWIATALGLVAIAHSLTLHSHPGPTGDNAEFQYLGRVLGVPHPTGYPLYLLLTHLWDRVLPFGTLAAKMNAFSLACGLGAGLGFAWLGRRLALSGPAVAAAFLLLALRPVWWRLSVTAEVYTLHAALVACALAAAVSWHQSRRDRDLRLALVFTALACSHHLSGLLLVPPLLLLAQRTGWGLLLRPGNLFAALALILLVFALYAWLFFRSRLPALAEMNYQRFASFADYWGYLTGTQFRGQMLAPNRLATDLRLEWAPFFAPLLSWRTLGLLFLPGLAVFVLRSGRAALPLLLYLLLGLSALVLYRIPDIADYSLPPLLLLALLLAGAFEHLWTWWRAAPSNPALRGAVLVLLALLTLPVARQAWRTAADLRIPRGLGPAREMAALLTESAPVHLLVPHWQQTNLARYYLHGEGLATRGHRVQQLVVPDALARGGTGLREHLGHALASGRAVYVFSQPGPLFDLAHALRAAGVPAEPRGEHWLHVRRLDP
jgi:hypothetical protein